ncbi:MAG: hypothetical protein N4J56_001734 [Chroococcidiopsis sp. SAG 2025]|uniref:DUF4082 domain-containing protein n=1 Tax=Chroococcidiopsis sp. SAG 2025 TaxID=171389 RepID=UPI0029372E00|nr:DUF4082 domain-containing protein [Chroococcidiopsis sp. SAG 2025]MDV2992080.1 hypothetical protein [Chroococcidiopsis sp. SAG 2025]
MKNYLVKLSKLIRNQNPSTGFTLVELLVAVAITTLVVSAAGFGLAAITENNKKAKVETERRTELNRALDFISDEVRQAKKIANDVSTDLSNAPDFDTTNKTPVLSLQIPGVSQRVIYYVASSSSPWIGPKVIYRWGPDYNSNGNYSNPTSPDDWTGKALVDLVEDSTPNTNNYCSTGWGANPPVSNRKGFYTCIDPSGRIAEIHLRGKLIDAYGNSRDPLEVSSKIFPRSYEIALGGPGAGGGGAGGGSNDGSNGGSNGGGSNDGSNGGSNSTSPPTEVAQCSVSGGILTCSQSTVLTFKVIGSSYACSGTSANWIVNTKITVDTQDYIVRENEILNLTINPGQQVKVASVPVEPTGKNCTNSDTPVESTNTTKVRTLRNGDNVPSVQAFSNQTSVEQYLRNYVSNGKINIGDKDIIYLFEIGQSNTNASGFDLQDNVVLVSLSNPSSTPTPTPTPTPSTSYSIWASSTTPNNVANDSQAVELGVKFKSDVDGYITGIRFYKGSSNTGTYIGNLWTSIGQKLATATFTNVAGTGWQQVNFAQPVRITANTVYVASYHTSIGRYAYKTNDFKNAGVNSSPLQALKDGVSGGNGVYKYGTTSSFPTDTYNSSNYWVDVVFQMTYP